MLLLPPRPSAAVRLDTTRLFTSSAADMRISSVKRFKWRRSAAGEGGDGGGTHPCRSGIVAI